jgi:hypothetical protein
MPSAILHIAILTNQRAPLPYICPMEHSFSFKVNIGFAFFAPQSTGPSFRGAHYDWQYRKILNIDMMLCPFCFYLY